MHTFWWLVGLLLAAVWVHRLLDTARGMPRIPDIARPEWDHLAQPGRAPRVSIVVPARNEEEHMETALASLLALDYPDYEIIAVDDRSTDRTGEILDRMAAQAVRRPRLQVLHVRELPAGWLGKTHAMWRAAQQATGEWILFTDADVVFRPDALRRAMNYAESARADHLALYPTFEFHTLGERMMMAFFQALFIFGHRPWKVADPNTRDHIGIGAFNLLRRSSYEAIGTYRALRLQVIDDMKLGEAIKRNGFAQRNVFGRDLLRLRWAHGALGFVENLTKNSFALMHFRWQRALGAAFLLVFLNLGPFLGLAFAPGWSRLGYTIAVAVIACVYLGESWYSDIRPYYFVLHPVSTVLFAYILLRSTVLTLWHGGVVWRGTLYPLEELRNGAAG